MKRRQFLRLLGLGLGSIAILPFRYWGKSKDLLEVQPFYVAGVRFHSTPQMAETGDHVVIKKESWRGERCYGIYTESEQRLGYVPRKLIPFFDNLADRNWRLECVNRYTVPWKRYKITLTP
jgi:hypothetical protein